jgi:hypothetical protein
VKKLAIVSMSLCFGVGTALACPHDTAESTDNAPRTAEKAKTEKAKDADKAKTEGKTDSKTAKPTEKKPEKAEKVSSK